MKRSKFNSRVYECKVWYNVEGIEWNSMLQNFTPSTLSMWIKSKNEKCHMINWRKKPKLSFVCAFIQITWTSIDVHWMERRLIQYFNSDGELGMKSEMPFNIFHEVYNNIVFRLIFSASKYLLQKGKNSSISIIFSFQSKLFTTICVLFLIICLVETHQRPSENQSVLLHRHKRSKELIDKFKKVRSSIVFGYEKNCIFF